MTQFVMDYIPAVYINNYYVEQKRTLEVDVFDINVPVLIADLR